MLPLTKISSKVSSIMVRLLMEGSLTQRAFRTFRNSKSPQVLRVAPLPYLQSSSWNKRGESPIGTERVLFPRRISLTHLWLISSIDHRQLESQMGGQALWLQLHLKQPDHVPLIGKISSNNTLSITWTLTTVLRSWISRKSLNINSKAIQKPNPCAIHRYYHLLKTKSQSMQE